MGFILISRLKKIHSLKGLYNYISNSCAVVKLGIKTKHKTNEGT